MPIPHIIHQIWMNPEENGIESPPPDRIQMFMNEWKQHHPEYRHILWNGNTMRNYMKKEFPEWIDCYDKFPSWIHRCDAFRFFILWKMGGVYVDADTHCKGSLDKYLGKKDGLVMITRKTENKNKDFDLTNCFMASSPKHPFYQKCIEGLKNSHSVNIFQSTGPTYLTNIYHQYNNIEAIRESELPIEHLADNTWFKTQAALYIRQYYWYIFIIIIVAIGLSIAFRYY